MLGYSIVIPILIFLVTRFGGNEFIYGFLGAMYPAFQLIGAPLLGAASDRIGRKKVLLISQIGTFFAWSLFIAAIFLPGTALLQVKSNIFGSFIITAPLLLLFVARGFDGLTGGNVSVANAYLSDVSTDDDRSANFGKMASSTSLGFIVGPALASLLAASVYGELLPVLLAALISLLAIFVIQRYLPESKQTLVSPSLKDLSIRKLFQFENKDCYKKAQCPERGLRYILKIRTIPMLFLIYFLTFLGFSFFYAGFPIYAAQYLNWSTTELGMFLTISSGIMVLVQGPVLTRLSQKIRPVQLMIAGSLLVGFSFLLLPSGSLTAIYIANVLLSVGNGIMWPSYMAILAKTGDSEIQGTIQGYANSAGSLASIFGLILGGTLFVSFGPTVFIAGGLVIMLIFILGFWLLNIPQNKGKEKVEVVMA
jgi:MFS family permease